MWQRDNQLVLTPAQIAEYSERARVKAAINLTVSPEARKRVESVYGKPFCMDRWPEAYGRETLGGPMRVFKDAIKTLKSLVPVLLIGVMLIAMVPAFADSTNPGRFRAPTVYAGAVNTKVYWTAGTINNGGDSVAVAAGSADLTTNMNDCSAPGYAACNFVYSDNAGTVAVTTTMATALAAGNTLLAFAETGAADAILANLVLPQQSGTLWRTAATRIMGQSCGVTNACAHTDISGSYRVVSGITEALNAASPSVAAVTGISPAFTNATSYACSATLEGNSAATAAKGLAITQVSGSAVTFTSANGATEKVHYQCIGY